MFRKNIFNVLELNQLQIYSLQEVKNYLRITHDYDDATIKSLIGSAIDSAENFLGLSLHERKIEFTCNIVGKRVFPLKVEPVVGIEEITFYEAKQSRQLAKDEYYFDAEYCTLYLKQALSGEELKVIFITGFAKRGLPDAIRQGIMLHICAMYDRDSDSSLTLSTEIKNLYYPYKRMRL